MLKNIVLELPTLYGISSTGKVKQWEIYVEIIDNLPWITTEYGYLDGETQITSTVVKEGKNLGRSNQTTPVEQAKAEATAKWNKKQLENYRETIPTEDSIALLPMLAQKYEDKKHKIIWPCYGQPKLNGVRCLASIKDGKVTFTSRKNKTYKMLKHVEKELLTVFEGEELVLDGEIFHPELGFQEIIRRVKREKTDRADIDHVKLQYWIYDVLLDVRYSERWNYLSSFDHPTRLTKHLKILETTTLKDEQELIEFNRSNLNAGFEGSMVRNGWGLYRPDYRSPDLLKYKLASFQEEDFEIVGGVSAKGRDYGTVVFICKTADGKEFSVRPKGTVEQRGLWLDDIEELKGKLLTVRFQEWSEDRIPIFPSGLCVRDYE